MESLTTFLLLIYFLIGLYCVVNVPDVSGQSDAEILGRWLFVAIFWPIWILILVLTKK
jgi:hypothetical protein